MSLWGDLSELNRLRWLHRPVSQPFDLEHHVAGGAGCINIFLPTILSALHDHSWIADHHASMGADAARNPNDPHMLPRVYGGAWATHSFPTLSQ
jgi:hypothetical protein